MIPIWHFTVILSNLMDSKARRGSSRSSAARPGDDAPTQRDGQARAQADGQSRSSSAPLATRSAPAYRPAVACIGTARRGGGAAGSPFVESMVLLRTLILGACVMESIANHQNREGVAIRMKLDALERDATLYE